MRALLATDLLFGPLGSAAAPVFRSGIFWLCRDGQEVRPGEAIGFFNINTDNRSGANAAEGERTRQVVVAAPVAGRLRIPENQTSDGLLGIWPVRAWDAEEKLAAIDEGPDGASLDLRLMVVAGRRAAWPVDSDAVLLPGGNWSARAWWGEAAGRRSLLCLGLCDVSGIVRGHHSAFTELFESAPFPAHIVHASEHPVIPCSVVVLEQFRRTADQRQQITADIIAALGTGTANADDLSFASLLLRQLCASPVTESHNCLGAGGSVEVGPPRRILLSLSSEPQSLLRHRKLGYHVYILSGDARAAGPAMRRWLKTSFEPVRRAAADIGRDLAAFAAEVGARTGARVMMINRLSTSGREDIYSYAGFAAPLGASLAYAAAKEMNVMLDDLVASGTVDLIDIDAMAAEFGAEAHLPDGIHHSSLMQTALRRALIQQLAA